MNTVLKDQRLSETDKEKYARKYASLVKHIARRMAVSLPSHVDINDLINEGIVGFMEALQRFDAGKGAQFKTYATNRIRGAILDHLRKHDFASRGARRRLRELHQAEEVLTHELGRFPTKPELASHLGVDSDEVSRRRAEGHIGFVASLDEPSLNDSTEETHLDRIACDRPEVDAICCKKERVRLLRSSLEKLQEREQLLLNLYYFEDLNIAEIAQVLSVSEARVSQLHRRALGKLREALE